jgi:acetylornithine deacetylase/succinyl-diaminopimelate desuccinylase-like protein
MPTYAVSGVAYDRNDIRAHGKDERESVEGFYRGVDFYYRLLKGVTAE